MLKTMSARNYFSNREKHKVSDCLPNISRQKFNYNYNSRSLVHTNSNNYFNRNVHYPLNSDSLGFDTDRAITPLSDFFSDSDTATPDFLSEESDSSAGSALQRNTAEASRILADEWERIERTIYDEEGEKVTRPQMLEECQQWKQLHPQLRIIGKKVKVPEKKISYHLVHHDEVICMQYSDYEECSESDERLSQSSSDVTPQNSPRPSIRTDTSVTKFSKDSIPYYTGSDDDNDLPNTFCSLLQIMPMQIHSPLQKQRQNSSILKSDLASSRWMRGNRPDSSFNFDRNSAKSFMSLDTRNFNNIALSASEHSKLSFRVVTAKQKDQGRLQPLYNPDVNYTESCKPIYEQAYPRGNRKVSLPPLLVEEEKRKIVSGYSAKKQRLASSRSKKSASRNPYHLGHAN